jgi:ketosteroid isomerase-like protein
LTSLAGSRTGVLGLPVPIVLPSYRRTSAMIISRRLLAIVGLAAVGPSAAAQTTNPVEARTLFERFVAAQNAHDAPAVEALLWDAPDFLWVPRTGIPIWGREAAMERFRANYRGNWRLEPEMAQFRAVTLGESAIQLFVPLMLTAGPPGEPTRPVRVLMNQTLVHTASGWRIATLLPFLPPN